MDFNLKIWRQKNAKEKGHFETYKISGIEEDASFLEMLDILNEQLIREGADPVAVERGCQSSGPVVFLVKIYVQCGLVDAVLLLYRFFIRFHKIEPVKDAIGCGAG